MAKDARKPELVDIVADALNMDILDRETFTLAVNQILIDYIAARLYPLMLVDRKVISPKKAPSDPRSTGGVTPT